MEKGTLPVTENWEPIEWGNNKISGLGYEITPAKRGNKKAKWAFTLVLPPEAKSFSVNYEGSDYGSQKRHTDKFVVKYVTAKEEKFIMVPLSFGDRRIDQDRFSVRLQS